MTLDEFMGALAETVEGFEWWVEDSGLIRGRPSGTWWRGCPLTLVAHVRGCGTPVDSYEFRAAAIALDMDSSTRRAIVQAADFDLDSVRGRMMSILGLSERI